MSLFEIEFGKMEKTITAQGKTITLLTKDKAMLQKDKTVLTKDNAALQKEIAEYRRRYGVLSGTAVKPSRTTKVRARNSAKARAAANKW